MRNRFVALCVMAAAYCAGCEVEPRCGGANLQPLERMPSYAVVTSDFSTSAIALLDDRGELMTEAWVDSGTERAALSATLSGDVVLPTHAVGKDTLSWIDRFGVDVITAVRMPNGRIDAQLPTTLPAVDGESAFRANPQDALRLDDGRLLVTRFEANLDGNARELDKGNDLVVLDEGDLVERIALDGLDVGSGRTRRVARPSRMVRIGDVAVIGLARLSLDFHDAAPGAVAVLDLSTRRVSSLPLPDLANCPEVVPVPKSPRAIAVCYGRPFVDAATRRATAGLAVVEVDGVSARVLTTWRASTHVDVFPVSQGAVALDDRHVLVAASDQRTGDQLLHVDLESGRVGVVLETRTPFVLGSGAFDPTTGLVLVPDAVDGIRRYDRHDGRLVARDVIECSPCRGLPPREVRRLR